MGVNRTTPLALYSNYWRTHRRLWHEHLGKKALDGYSRFIYQKSKDNVLRLLDTEQDTFTTLRLFVTQFRAIKLLLTSAPT